MNGGASNLPMARSNMKIGDVTTRAPARHSRNEDHKMRRSDMGLQKLMTALATIAVQGVPAIAAAQAAEHEQHHPQDDAALPAANAESESGTAPGPAASAGEATGTATPQKMAGQMMGQGMMGAGMSDMMGTDMMRMMHQVMDEASAPIVIVVPVPVSGGEAMRPGMMQRDMMRPGMMDMMGGPGPDMARGGMARMGGDGGSTDLTSGVVKPAIHLSAADVRHFLEHRLESHGNPRLAVGEVTEAGADAITANIVTADGSLVDRLSVDRHSGAIVRVP
jgi:hypothetical protein